jgi:hypothetical protein
MKNLIVELRIDGKLDNIENNTDRDVRVVRAVLDKIHLNVVDLTKYTEVGENYESDDIAYTESLLNDETIVYVQLEVEPENESFYDDSYTILKYVADAIDFRPAKVTNFYEREYGKFTRTFITIIVGEVIDGVAVE